MTAGIACSLLVLILNSLSLAVRTNNILALQRKPISNGWVTWTRRWRGRKIITFQFHERKLILSSYTELVSAEKHRAGVSDFFFNMSAGTGRSIIGKLIASGRADQMAIGQSILICPCSCEKTRNSIDRKWNALGWCRILSP